MLWSAAKCILRCTGIALQMDMGCAQKLNRNRTFFKSRCVVLSIHVKLILLERNFDRVTKRSEKRPANKNVSFFVEMLGLASEYSKCFWVSLDIWNFHRTCPADFPCSVDYLTFLQWPFKANFYDSPWPPGTLLSKRKITKNSRPKSQFPHD